MTDVLVVNETEAAQWVWPVPHQVTTLGARGASYAGDGAEFTVAAPAVDPVDTSGAGDVFAGVLAASWTDDRDRRCAGPAPPARSPRWFPVPATARRMPTRSTTRRCRADFIR